MEDHKKRVEDLKQVEEDLKYWGAKDNSDDN